MYFLLLMGKILFLDAVKVGTGKINAVTGKPWKSKAVSASSEDQNYVSIPKQLWLDGINCGDGYIRQFVAMPLGEGYTVEVWFLLYRPCMIRLSLLFVSICF